MTGIGPVTPVGVGREQFWTSLVAGRSGIGHLTRFDASGLDARIAGQVEDFECSAFLDPQRARRAELFTHFAFAASRLALDDAKLRIDDVEPGRAGVVMGCAYGGISRIETEVARLLAKGPRAVMPEISLTCSTTAAAAFLSMEFGLTGPTECMASGCASGAHAVSRGADLIRSGQADVVLAGGTDAPLTPLCMAAFCSARALSTRNDVPAAASRPFDRNRDGFVFSEGAVVLVLERLDCALARGAPVLAELLGHGHSADAHNWGAPHPEGHGAAQAMASALRAADVTPADIGYVNAHAASTPLGDLAEARAIEKVFRRALPPVSSTKSMTGHLLGAAGALEAAATVLAVHTEELPPTINVESLDPECGLDVIARQRRREKVDAALSNSFGVGGINASLVVGRY
ncbi:beta-ketoacyl-[acyl-carrier-protein] synthase family protein [Streptomyces djakartensis]|uniref:beta-ketoacyl-[acyl-carrier-protein] synthase family protein n=1 Tax=Streptomyces djakartensis TaxID=68193 RepID=UPI00167C79C2|nr:beta-ketoacyl-ACP synthase II [Streptomyces djakartensis]